MQCISLVPDIDLLNEAVFFLILILIISIIITMTTKIEWEARGEMIEQQ